jgi:predicted enzyme related to lactoylglutathione lyase
MADRAARLSADVIDPPRDTPGFRAALLADPQGATFPITQLL